MLQPLCSLCKELFLCLLPGPCVPYFQAFQYIQDLPVRVTFKVISNHNDNQKKEITLTTAKAIALTIVTAIKMFMSRAVRVTIMLLVLAMAIAIALVMVVAMAMGHFRYIKVQTRLQGLGE